MAGMMLTDAWIKSENAIENHFQNNFSSGQQYVILHHGTLLSFLVVFRLTMQFSISAASEEGCYYRKKGSIATPCAVSTGSGLYDHLIRECISINVHNKWKLQHHR